jgi:hypothetical protein
MKPKFKAPAPIVSSSRRSNQDQGKPQHEPAWLEDAAKAVLADGFGGTGATMPSAFGASMHTTLSCMPCDIDPVTHRPTRPQPRQLAIGQTTLYFISWTRGQSVQLCPGGKVPCPFSCRDSQNIPTTELCSRNLVNIIGSKGKARAPFQVLVQPNGSSAFVIAELSKCTAAACPSKGAAFRHSDGRVLEQVYSPVHHTPHTIHHTPYIIHHTSYTIHHTPHTIHHTPHTIHHTP